jgi:hypothetical protein
MWDTESYFLVKSQFCGCRGSSFPSYSTTYSSLSGSSGGYGFPPPNSGRGFVLARDLVGWAPTVWLCCSRWVSVLCCSTGCVRVLARLAVAAVDNPPATEDEEPVELEEVDTREALRSALRAASAFSKSRCLSMLLRADHVRVASTSARSRSRSTSSIFLGALSSDAHKLMYVSVGEAWAVVKKDVGGADLDGTITTIRRVSNWGPTERRRWSTDQEDEMQ